MTFSLQQHFWCASQLTRGKGSKINNICGRTTSHWFLKSQCCSPVYFLSENHHSGREVLWRNLIFSAINGLHIPSTSQSYVCPIWEGNKIQSSHMNAIFRLLELIFSSFRHTLELCTSDCRTQCHQICQQELIENKIVLIKTKTWSANVLIMKNTLDTKAQMWSCMAYACWRNKTNHSDKHTRTLFTTGTWDGWFYCIMVIPDGRKSCILKRTQRIGNFIW